MIWLLVALGVLVVLFGIFVAVQRARRSGGVVVRRDVTAKDDGSGT